MAAHFWVGRLNILAERDAVPLLGNAVMANKERLESLTGIEQDVQIEERTRLAMEDYFGWRQTTMSSLPWSNTNLNRILLSNATRNVTATFAFMHKLSQAKSFQEVVKIQTEFMETQMNSFNEQAKVLGEVYTKAAEDAVKGPFGIRR
jgi:Phasin protein